MNLKKNKWKLVGGIFLGLILALSVIFSGIIYVKGANAGKLSIHIEQDYKGGEIITIYASLVNYTGARINASTYCNVTITHWNSTALVTDLDNVEMNFTGEEGWYYYLWTIPDAADFGSYGVLVRADPNEVDTQATSGFHVAEWAKEIGFLWEVTKRTETNTSVIHNESIISANLSSQFNITLWYNITIPLKEGYTSADYLPVRWKFWFVDVDTNMCVDQSREQRYVSPQCNPLVAQFIGLGNSTYEVNISIRPSLPVGNYTLIRELEVDPEQVWISYGHGPIGKITVLEDNTEPVVDTEAKKEGVEGITTVTTTTTSPSLEGQCIELVVPVTSTVTTTVTTIKEKAAKVKVTGIAAKEGGKLGFLVGAASLLVISGLIIFYLTYQKKGKEKKEERGSALGRL